jgi:catechol 2,3-dioxygenase-like lactoylglutathione lyase family enzyme
MDPNTNVKQAVPFFAVKDMDATVQFYTDGLGFKITKRWDVNGSLRWCWMELDAVAMMFQTDMTEEGVMRMHQGKVGDGTTISFQCTDALAIYHSAKASGLSPTRPQVGNGMWITALADPDGYRLEFESFTDVPEETLYSEPG